MIKILFSLMFLPFFTFSQIVKLDPVKVTEHEITQVKIRLRGIVQKQAFDSLVVSEYHYNSYGFKTFEKRIFPYQDVVATEKNYYYKYTKDTLLSSQIETSNAIRLTEKDDKFLRSFGVDYDTTFTQYKYLNNGLLQEKIKYSNKNVDTIKTVYFYTPNGLVHKTRETISSFPDLVHWHNTECFYFYSKNDLLDSIHEYPLFSDLYAREIFTYDESNKLIETRKCDGFEYSVRIDVDKNRTIQLTQDPLKGTMEIFQYDSEGRVLVKKQGFYNLAKIDLITINIYNEKGQIQEQIIERPINFEREEIVHDRLFYDAENLMIKQESIVDDIVHFYHTFEYIK